MHRVELKIDNSIYDNVMFLLKNIKSKGLEIKEIDDSICDYEVDDEIKKTSFLQSMKYVISAEMMQTYQEDLDGAIKELNEADAIPEILKNDDIKISDIKYNGDLRKKDFHGGI